MSTVLLVLHTSSLLNNMPPQWGRLTSVGRAGWTSSVVGHDGRFRVRHRTMLGVELPSPSVLDACGVGDEARAWWSHSPSAVDAAAPVPISVVTEAAAARSLKPLKRHAWWQVPRHALPITVSRNLPTLVGPRIMFARVCE
jgi:hypothetical protein